MSHDDSMCSCPQCKPERRPKPKCEVIMPLDGKVTGRLFKNSTGEEIPPDEFVVFRPHDNAFFDILPQYVCALVRNGASIEQTKAAVHLYDKVLAWRNANINRCKTPDISPNEAPKGW